MKTILLAEIKKYWSEIKTYYPDHIVSMVITFVIFSVFFLLNKVGNNDPSYYIGFLYWYLISSVISEASVSVSMEKQLGTLDQLLLKPIKIEVLMIIKTLVWTTINLLKVVFVMSIMVVCLNMQIGLDYLLIPIFIITIIGILGFTLILVGLTLKYTKTASFESIISYALLFLSGAIIPYDALPNIIKSIGNYIPIALGIKLSRSLLISGKLDLIDFTLLFVQSIIYFTVGYILFQYIYKMSRVEGLDKSY